MLVFCFSGNNSSDVHELLEDLDDFDELWDVELLLDFRDLEDIDNFELLYFDLEVRWDLLFAGFDRISLPKGFTKYVLHRESSSLDSSKKFSTVLVISTTRNSWFLKTFIALSISSGSTSLQYSWFVLYISFKSRSIYFF